VKNWANRLFNRWTPKIK